MSSFQAAYARADARQRLRSKAAAAVRMLDACRLCPRECGVHRRAHEHGFCRTGRQAKVSSYGPHFGEEAPLVGRNGSGTIFFTHCNLLCLYCQNFDISHLGDGQCVSDRQLADLMLSLQAQGCHNINLVTPSHVVPQLLTAVALAAGQGLEIPIVYNSGGYDRVETLRLLEGVVDIYMPDFKFWDPQVAEAACQAPDYPQVARAALQEMHRQVGDLVVSADGLAQRGLLVRHLVMPAGRAGTDAVMQFIAQRISMDTYVNIMPQYRPCGRAQEIAEFGRVTTGSEYRSALQAARRAGLKRLDPPRRVFALT